MAPRTVRGTDGRVWAVRRQMMLRMPAYGEELEFEHDVEGGRIGQWVVVALLALFVFAMLIWSFSGDVGPIGVPWFVKLAFIMILLFFPARWLLRRPWKLVAQTQGGFDPVRNEMLPPEAWEGTVRGLTKARDECGLVVNTIKKRGRLSKADGLMKKIN